MLTRNQPSRSPTAKPVFFLRVLVLRYLVSWTAYTVYRLCAQFLPTATLSPVHTRRTPKSRVDMTSVEVLAPTAPASPVHMAEHRLPNTLHLITFIITLFVTADVMRSSARGVGIMSPTC